MTEEAGRTGPFGWKRVGDPIDIPDKDIEIRISNDNPVSQFGAAWVARERLIKPECTALVERTTSSVEDYAASLTAMSPARGPDGILAQGGIKPK